MSLLTEWYQIHDENSEQHRASTEEMAFYQAVSSGDIHTVRKNCRQHRFTDMTGVGQLSRDPLRNLRYHFVVTAALITRICAQSGMIEEEAFQLSDYYIQKMDLAKSVDEVAEIHDTMVLDFTGKMRLMSEPANTSRTITTAMNYIFNNINDSMTVEEVADACKVSQSYLSRQFKKEMGVSVSEYIRQKKVETAAHLLRFSDFSEVDIAARLSFSSQSHFIQVFRKSLGITPKKYRQKYGIRQWIVTEHTPQQ